jgi:hypothetical protein
MKKRPDNHRNEKSDARQPFGTTRTKPGVRSPGVLQTCVIVISVFLACLSPAFSAFVHPGQYSTAADLAFMRAKIEAKAEPWSSAWAELQAEPHSKLAWTPHAVADWDANADAYMQGDALAAYSQALQWALTGQQEHADKAVEILNAWSSTLQTVHGDRSQEMVVCGWNGCKLANAAELLRYYTPADGKPSGWKDADIQRFTKMLGILTNVMKPFKPTFNGNWDAAMMNSLMCIAVFTDDQDLFKTVTDHFAGKYPTANTPRDKGHLAVYIQPSTGECEESGRDQGHTQMGLGNYVSVCEVAWKQGVDLYSTENNLLLLGLEYTAKYNLGNNVPYAVLPTHPEWTIISAKNRGVFLPIWEAPYQHYVVRQGLAMPFTKQVLADTSAMHVTNKTPGNYRPEPSSLNSGICWGTLTMYKGAEEPPAASK